MHEAPMLVARSSVGASRSIGISVIDNVFPEPEKIRAYAKTLLFYQRGFWAGLSTAKRPDEPSDIEPLELIRRKMKFQHIWWGPDNPQGHFRLALARDKPKCAVHVDCSAKGGGSLCAKHHYSAVIYLSPPGSPTGTLDFYKCNATHKAWVDSEEEFEMLGARGSFFDASQWQKWRSVETLYNRAIVFNAVLFHNPGEPYGFGSGFDDGRLNYSLWFYSGFDDYKPEYQRYALPA
jgi:hypothetical protein